MNHLLRRLTSDGPKRILALDGGGTRGIITLAFLLRIETILRWRTGNDTLVLADYFDLIGGTSVGSLIAAMLAKGDDVAKVIARFEAAAPKIFKKKLAGRVPLAALFSADPLRKFIEKEVGRGTLLKDPQFCTGLAVVAKRLDTGSAWVLTNCPSHPYFAPQTKGNDVRKGNGDYLVADVLRASTAAPRYFSPKSIGIYDAGQMDSMNEGVFVDGGASPHNNPSLMLFMMAAMRGFNMGGGELKPHEARKPWALGEDNLLIVSVGTGGFTHTARQSWTAAGDGLDALLGVMSDSQELVLTILQWLSGNGDDRAWPLNRVMGNLAGEVLGPTGGLNTPLLSFQRYDAPLEPAWLKAHLDKSFRPSILNALRDFTNADDLVTLKGIGMAAAARQVQPEHFPATFDIAEEARPI